jgi:two-component system, chemotaxis family, sensor kinase CheA
MDLRRFVDLYVSETQEHLSLLQRSLVELERDPAGPAIAEAFRAAHTVKGLSAAMGYSIVAGLAHRLEDQLSGVRDGAVAPDAALIDELLKAADELEAAVGVSILTPPDGPEDGTDSAAAGSLTAAGLREPPRGSVVVVHVALFADAPMKAVRGTLIVRALDGLADVLGTDPAEFDDAFGGRLRIFLGAAADAMQVEARVRGAGDVESVRMEPLAVAPVLEAAARSATAQPRQVRVDAGRLDSVADNLAELSVLYGRVQRGVVPAPLAEVLDRIGAVLSDLDHDVRALRMVPVRAVFQRLPRVVRDAARAVGREVELVLKGDDVEVDRTILDEIVDPIVHLLRNAVDHGIEPPSERAAAGKSQRGCIRVEAQRERGSVCIIVADDGHGVPRSRVVAKARAAGLHDGPDDVSDEALFRLMSHPGLSTADSVSAVSGRGVGVDVVVSRVRALGGAIDMRSRTGAGTEFTMRLPITLAFAQALRVRVGGDDYAIPLTHVTGAIELGPSAAGVISVRSQPIRLVRMRSMLQVDSEGRESAAVIFGIGNRRAALAVDELVGREQITVKPFDAVAGMLPYFSGATLLADGRPALILDPLSLI